MEYVGVNEMKAIRNISDCKQEVSKLYTSFTKEYVYDVAYIKWRAAAKDNFIETSKKVSEKIKKFADKLDEAALTMNEVEELKIIDKKRENLLEENKRLASSGSASGVIQQNEQTIMLYTDQIKQIKMRIAARWGLDYETI